MAVGNGETCYFWSSNWSPFGNLKDYLANDRANRLPIDQQSTLAELWENGQWVMPPARSNEQVNVFAFLSTISINNELDALEWKPDDICSDKFSTGKVYNILRENRFVVSWHKEVWHSGGIPRHMFLTWLVVLNRCPTRDRLMSWGIQTASTCVLCNTSDESISHLFFECQFSWEIWYELAQARQFGTARSLPQLLDQLKAFNQSKASRTLLLLTWQSAIYHLWRERNSRIHRSHFSSASMIIKDIKLVVKNRITSLRTDRPKIASAMMQLWFA